MNKRIIINGAKYPVRMTMGAFLYFKRETGRDVSEIKNTDVADLVTFLWCIVAAASAADKVPFNLSLEEFANALTPDALSILEDVSGNEEGAKKKTE
ncbi:MAG: hypothetical protein II851_02555 [Bacteroidales bacterium]|nr:hypothetical protein [Bacteroidales bacterium]